MRQPFHTFSNVQEVHDYRYEQGTGGWIFASDTGDLVILFPPHLSPQDIFCHAFTRCKSGRLIG